MLWIKAFHIMSVIAWMAGLFYLPRLFVYHCNCPPGSEQSATFKIMERRLMRVIMNPAMIATWIFGLTLAYMLDTWTEIWFIIKMLAVFSMTVFHHYLSTWRKQFDADANTYDERFYRLCNEVPTVLMAIIVIMVVVKPF